MKECIEAKYLTFLTSLKGKDRLSYHQIRQVMGAVGLSPDNEPPLYQKAGDPLV